MWTLASPLPTTLLVLEDVDVKDARAVDSDSVFIDAKEEVLLGSLDLTYGDGFIAFVYGHTSIIGSFVHSSCNDIKYIYFKIIHKKIRCIQFK